MTTDPQAAYQFGQFTLVPTERRPVCDGKVVPLTPKVFDTLVAKTYSYMPYGVAFSIDLLLPLVSLRDAHYNVDLRGLARYYFYFHRIVGYVLASFIVAGVSGLTK